ncbi:MAG: biotin--[acetyl-CoA-carboxylase] ligase [Gemmatimonadetes bacterium]|nr:biotin--[acetyl-CoA-carboxylase] ligase [Gemmatimonadota bacterium]
MTDVGATMLAEEAGDWAGEPVAALRELWGRESVFAFDRIPSTNDLARELAEAGSPSGTIVLCRQQTAGRGRAGRSWTSPAGAGVYLSMAFRLREATVPPLVTVVAGVDLARELNRRFPGLASAVKWPNDLMARERKLGGILAETARADGREAFLVVGVGINVESGRLPDEVDGAVALADCVGPARLVDVADAVVAGLERRLPRAPTSLDAASLDELDRFDWLKNRWVEHRLSDREPAVGLAAGIAPDGALLLRPRGGALRRVVAGSIALGGS